MKQAPPTIQKYIRLLSYPNACKVIEFVNKNDKNDYANITTGGVSMQLSEKNIEKVEEFVKSLGVRYEIGNVAPYKVNEQIVKSLKDKGVI
jgi:anaerobic ribonucleoside-triphosphate reductase